MRKKWFSMMLLGLMTALGLGLSAKAERAYSDYLVSGDDGATAVEDKTVRFNNLPWHIIADNSTAENEGTVTLLAAHTFWAGSFDTSEGNAYKSATLKTVLDLYTKETGSFYDVRDLIVDADLEDVDVTGAKLWLLSKDEAKALPTEVRKYIDEWWLRTSAEDAKVYYDASGETKSAEPYQHKNVRPALQLNLSFISFDAATKTFAPKTHNHDYTYTARGSVITAVCGSTVERPCPLPENRENQHYATLTIGAPDLKVAGGTESAEAIITDANGIRGGAAINYYKASREGDTYTKSEEALTFVPDTAGYYVAEITVGGAIASVGYTIVEDLTVGGIQVTSENASNITGGETVTASYDAAANTLTLNGYQYEGGDENEGILYKGSDDFVIALEGDSTIESSGVALSGESASPRLTILGTGSLTATGSDGIRSEGEIDIISGTVTGVSSGSGEGIRSGKDIVITGGTVIAEAKGSGGYGIVAESGISIEGEETAVTASAASGYAILARSEAVTIQGGTVTVQNSAIGIYTLSEEGILLEGGTVMAEGITKYAIVGDMITIGSGIEKLVSSGGESALSGTVKNAVAGIGWEDAEGTEGKAVIPVSAGSLSEKYKKVQFPQEKPVAAAVTANDRDYDGTEKPLVTVTGEPIGGTMQYAQGSDGQSEPTEWGTEIPAAADAGIYYVWYRVLGDLYHQDTDPQAVRAAICPEFSSPAAFALPKSAAQIGENAFAGDERITVVDAGGCAAIGAGAFRGCTGLTQIRLPGNCKIQDTAFEGCKGVFVFAPAGGKTEDFCDPEKQPNCFFVKE